MLKDIGFLIALVTGVASSVGAIVMISGGRWLEATACGFAFAACLVIAFWLAMTNLLEDSHQ